MSELPNDKTSWHWTVEANNQLSKELSDWLDPNNNFAKGPGGWPKEEFDNLEFLMRLTGPKLREAIDRAMVLYAQREKEFQRKSLINQFRKYPEQFLTDGSVND